MTEAQADSLIAAINNLASVMATQHATVGADALQLATVLGPALAPVTVMFWVFVAWVLWLPCRMILKRSGVWPK